MFVCKISDFTNVAEKININIILAFNKKSAPNMEMLTQVE